MGETSLHLFVATSDDYREDLILFDAKSTPYGNEIVEKLDSMFRIAWDAPENEWYDRASDVSMIWEALYFAKERGEKPAKLFRNNVDKHFPGIPIERFGKWEPCGLEDLSTLGPVHVHGTITYY